jgi:hypothetical protein
MPYVVCSDVLNFLTDLRHGDLGVNAPHQENVELAQRTPSVHMLIKVKVSSSFFNSQKRAQPIDWKNG